jgi:trypsin
VVTNDAHGLPIEIAKEHNSDHPYNLANTTTNLTNPKVTLKQTKIINGISTPRSSYPSIVRLHSSYPGPNPDNSPTTFYCGGTLIAPDIIATAAHCLGDEAYVDIYSVEEASTKTYKIVKSVVHPKYDETVFGYDFALIKIESVHVGVETNESGNEPFWDLMNEYDWENSPPIMRLHRYQESSASCNTLSRIESKQVTTLKVLGYGRVSYPKGPISYLSLRSADVHYLPNEECNKLYLKSPPSALANKVKGLVVTNDMLCAHNIKEKQDACSGDSGGPLVAKIPASRGALWSLAGIISWGIGCALSDYPGVYSRVAAEIDWIEISICNRENGLSPLSCVAGDSGKYQLRDYAAEALAKDNNNDVLKSGRWERNRDSKSLTLRRKRIPIQFSFNTASISRQSVANFKACELLEGPLSSSISSSTSTSSPNSRPIKLEMKIQSTCPRNNQFDISYFIAEGNNDVRDCFWVKSSCRNRCDIYSSCCPETCERCQG